MTSIYSMRISLCNHICRILSGNGHGTRRSPHIVSLRPTPLCLSPFVLTVILHKKFPTAFPLASLCKSYLLLSNNSTFFFFPAAFSTHFPHAPHNSLPRPHHTSFIVERRTTFPATLWSSSLLFPVIYVLALPLSCYTFGLHRDITTLLSPLPSLRCAFHAPRALRPLRDTHYSILSSSTDLVISLVFLPPVLLHRSHTQFSSTSHSISSFFILAYNTLFVPAHTHPRPFVSRTFYHLYPS